MNSITATWNGQNFVPNEPVTLLPGTEVTAYLPETPEEKAQILKRRFPNSFAVIPHEDAEEIRQIIRESRREQDGLIEKPDDAQ